MLISRHAKSIGFVQLDVMDAAALEHLVNRFDDLHCLVNAAGIIARRDEFDVTRFTDVLEVNLIAVQRLSTMCYPKLKSGGGSILNIGSLDSHLGAPHSPGYAASKGGVVQLTKSLAAAWAVDGIRVNALAPGWIETAFTEPLRNDPERNAAGSLGATGGGCTDRAFFVVVRGFVHHWDRAACGWWLPLPMIL